MKCVACKKPMIVVEHENIELDYCDNCSGVWFDAGEVALLMEAMGLESAGLDSLHLAAEAKSSEGTRKCPECNKKMKKIALGHTPELIIDVCPQEDGLWFDSGEVGQLVAHLSAQIEGTEDSQERVIEFLGEVFKVRE
ncbi:MAG: zf-TFIIB domain-containing protein [Dehalococcoidales bacterium]|nr:MAG: zf-TFIIB domain-containing protein [Dehalococcoidales bacterium]